MVISPSCSGSWESSSSFVPAGGGFGGAFLFAIVFWAVGVLLAVGEYFELKRTQ